MIIPAGVLTALALVLTRRRVAAQPGLLLALVFMAFAAFGAVAWNWSRDTNGAGLPSQFAAGTGVSSTGASIFFSAAAGCAAGALIAGLVTRVQFSFASMRRALSSRSVTNAAQIASIVGFVLWLLGQGPSVLERDHYLQTDGNQAFLTAFSLVGPLLAVAAYVLATMSDRPRTRAAGHLLASVWWASTVSVGTRIAVGFVIVALLSTAIRIILSRRVPITIIRVALLYCLSYLALATFAITIVARSQPHGLRRLVRLFADPTVPRFADPNSWETALKWLTSSISAGFPLTEQSAIHSPGVSILVANLNPLPSSLLHVDPYTYERLWPYYWVPLGFLGEWFGAFGSIGCVLLLAAICFTAGMWSSLFEKRRVHVGVLIVLVLCVTLSLLMVQYPSRSTGRVISFVIFGPLILLTLVGGMRLLRPNRFASTTERDLAHNERTFQ